MRVRVLVHACECVRVCVCARARACVRACVHLGCRLQAARIKHDIYTREREAVNMKYRQKHVQQLRAVQVRRTTDLLPD